MSKDDAKPINTKAKEAAAPAASAPASSGAAALVPAAAPTQAAAPAPVPAEELTGHGGLYTRRAGVTTLTHRTTNEEKAPQ